MYDYNWYVGLVEDVCEEECDVRVSLCIPKELAILKIVSSGLQENIFVISPKVKYWVKFQLQYLLQRVHGSITFWF